ncbi:hypothetical protein NCU05158 [Neurospora crassa OR74A]|uniref:Uncharacterized protein n=2 Tax=Neurospora crassa TaxID=5141 RepID=Q1K584_NEUCR|nr:hypothetical protein NCU05158 [Neurospora crassa OR74A]EAA27420.1 hypothetical protein NCU05158 [Neurospora crassa OR74A]CAD70563.1 hypothetical protein [Neurospora crassa]|eukprot:XP_956656.1 hypothetical protein NCU05158 [Neurospora crassa OR74A]
MSTHTTPHLDRKVLLALVPLASLAASHEGNPNAHGPVNFSEIAESITAAATTSTSGTQPASAIETSNSSSSSHSTHLTPSLLHGIIPSVTASTSTSPTPEAADQTRTQTVWATVAQVTEIIIVIKTLPLTPDHQASASDTSTSSSTTTSSQNTDTDPLVIIPVTGTVTDLINYDTYTAPASLPPLPPLLPPPRPKGSASSKSSSISDDGPLEIIPVTGTVTDLVDYETVMVPSATATTVVVIPVSSGSGSGSSGSTKSQDVGQMLGHIQGMGGQSNSRVLVHPTVSVGDRLTVVVSGSDGRTTITRDSPVASASSSPEAKGEGSGGEFCKEEKEDEE